MKRVLFLFVFLSFVGGVAGGADAKRSISGVVKCDDGNSSFAQCAGATVVCEKTSTIGVVADFEGKFGLSCPNDEGILVEFMGMDGVKISAAELDKKSTGLSIELKSSATAIEEVVVKGCTVNKEKGIKSATDIDGKCYPTECISPRWELIGKNKNARCKEQKCNTGWEQGEDGTWSCETIKTEENKKTEEKSQGYSDAEIKELQEKADDAKANEQLLANRMLGGATMAATGAGGQMLATGLAEKKADADAERQMTAYLQTMHCDYADGKQVSGGMKSVMLPGGNELINLYSQYVNLANDLKSRKLALGMRPGIESEPILDGATSGLYDDVSLGKTGGAYVSLARALMNPDGADAVAWAAQKEESQKDIKTGAIVAGVGAAVGIAGNMIINSEKAVEQRNAERHCTDAGGKWNKTSKTCVGANCGADMKWDDNKNTCIYTDPSRYEKGIVTSETEAATDDKTEMTGERVGDAGVVNTQENVAEQKCADVGGVWNVETKKCDNPQCPGVEEWDDEKYKCVKKNTECTEEETKGMLNASLIKRDKENGKCFIQKCACGYDLVNGECIEWKDKSCTSTTNPPVPEHAKTALMKCDGKKAYCHVMDCEGDYKPNDNNKKCVPIKCTEDALAELKARTGSFENGKCVPKTCIKDWHLVDGECMGPATYSAKKRCEKVGGTWADDECNNPQCDADKRWVGGVLNHCICKSGKENKKGVCVKAEEDILEGGGLDGGVSAVSADDLSIPTDEVRRSGASVIESESSTGPVQKSAAQQGCENTGGRWNDTNNDCTCSGVGKIWYSEWNECSCDRTKYMTDSDGGCLTFEEYEKKTKDNVANNYVKMDDWKVVVQGNQGIVYLKKNMLNLVDVFSNACNEVGGKMMKDDTPERVSSLHEWVDRGFNYGAEIKYQCEVTADDVMEKFDAEISKNPVLAKAKDEYPDRYPQVLLYFLDDLDGAGNPYAVLILNVQIGFD